MTPGLRGHDPVLHQRLSRLPAAARAELASRLRRRVPQSPAWVRTHPSDAPRRLFCFSYAGGGASVFRTWGAALPAAEVWAAQLPGRETRIGEPGHRRMDALLDELHRAITPHLDRPFDFFGHSMGALVAFELARRLRRCGAPQPGRLLLAAFRAPQLPNPNIAIHHLPDEVLKTVLRTEGTPQQVLDSAELMRALLPTLRADLELCDTYRYVSEPALAMPISVFGGTHDARVSRADLAQWQAQAGAGFRLTMLPGPHMFIHSAQDLLLAEISHRLEDSE